jgi:hypothetical protein
MYLKETICEDVNLVQMAHDRVSLWAVVNIVKSTFRLHEREGC